MLRQKLIFVYGIILRMKNVFLLFIIFSLSLYAHQVKENYLQLDYNNSTKILTLNLEVETKLLEDRGNFDDNKNEIISFKELYAHQDFLFSYVKNHLRLICENKKLTLSDAKITFHRYQYQTYMQITKSFYTCPLEGLYLEYNLFFEWEPSHKLLIHLGANKGDFVLDKTKKSSTFSIEKMSQFQRLYLFIKEGISHILDGLDHLLFLLMILIPSVIVLKYANNVKEFKNSGYLLLKIITTFSVAHSLTLFIAGIGWWIPDVVVIESSIALSIFIVALLNFLGKYKHVDKKIVFLFGLLHGFGFANVLEIAQVDDFFSFLIALFGFNVGVEIGQIFVISLYIPFLYFVAKQKYSQIAIKLITFIAMGISLFWFLQRIGWI